MTYLNTSFQTPLSEYFKRWYFIKKNSYIKGYFNNTYFSTELEKEQVSLKNIYILTQEANSYQNMYLTKKKRTHH